MRMSCCGWMSDHDDKYEWRESDHHARYEWHDMWHIFIWVTVYHSKIHSIDTQRCITSKVSFEGRYTFVLYTQRCCLSVSHSSFDWRDVSMSLVTYQGVTCEWVMSHVNESCHISMSLSCHISRGHVWGPGKTDEASPLNEWVMSHINESCHISMSLVTSMGHVWGPGKTVEALPLNDKTDDPLPLKYHCP